MGIHYQKLWETLENRGMTKYTLTHYFDLSPRMITKLQRNETVNTTTIDKLCSILQCNVEDILTYEEDNLNLNYSRLFNKAT
ncbi:DNA-binding transcriptional regulator, XRE family [Lachnospiraceae bacterium XBB1006]|nr:DNA-binding transcriptional regulator, XRE family [Lachnospiraceae bacterium XBB1006]